MQQRNTQHPSAYADSHVCSCGYSERGCKVAMQDQRNQLYRALDCVGHLFHGAPHRLDCCHLMFQLQIQFLLICFESGRLNSKICRMPSIGTSTRENIVVRLTVSDWPAWSAEWWRQHDSLLCLSWRFHAKTQVRSPHALDHRAVRCPGTPSAPRSLSSSPAVSTAAF